MAMSEAYVSPVDNVYARCGDAQPTMTVRVGCWATALLPGAQQISQHHLTHLVATEVTIFTGCQLECMSRNNGVRIALHQADAACRVHVPYSVR
jgi:hypothetical protein